VLAFKNGAIICWFPYKKRFPRARDMPVLYTSALVGALLAAEIVSAAAPFWAAASAR
jgi:hypothetical protein